MLRFLNLLSTPLLNIRSCVWMFCDAAICSPARWLPFFCGCQATKTTYAIMGQCLIKNSVSCTREYANLHSLLIIIQYQCWDSRTYLPKQLFGVNTWRLCNSTRLSTARVIFTNRLLATRHIPFWWWLNKNYVLCIRYFFSFCLHLPTLRYGFTQFQAIEELTNHISLTGQKDTRMKQR